MNQKKVVKQAIKELVLGDNIEVNKKYVAKFGGKEAILLSALETEMGDAFKSGQLSEEDGGFYCTVEKLESKTGLDKEQQDQALENLENQNIIKTFINKSSSKRYFLVDILN